MIKFDHWTSFTSTLFVAQDSLDEKLFCCTSSLIIALSKNADLIKKMLII